MQFRVRTGRPGVTTGCTSPYNSRLPFEIGRRYPRTMDRRGTTKGFCVTGIVCLITSRPADALTCKRRYVVVICSSIQCVDNARESFCATMTGDVSHTALYFEPSINASEWDIR